MVLYHNTRRVDKNIYKSVSLSRAAIIFCLWGWNTLLSRLAATTCPYYIYFTIPNSEIRSAIKSCCLLFLFVSLKYPLK